MTMVFIPSTQVLNASPIVNIPSATPIVIPTREASNAAWKSATEASDWDNASKIPLNDNGDVFIKVMRAWSLPSRIVV